MFEKFSIIRYSSLIVLALTLCLTPLGASPAFAVVGGSGGDGGGQPGGKNRSTLVTKDLVKMRSSALETLAFDKEHSYRTDDGFYSSQTKLLLKSLIFRRGNTVEILRRMGRLKSTRARSNLLKQELAWLGKKKVQTIERVRATDPKNQSADTLRTVGNPRKILTDTFEDLFGGLFWSPEYGAFWEETRVVFALESYERFLKMWLKNPTAGPKSK